MSRDIFNWIRLRRALSNLTLKVFRDGASTTSLGNLCQGFTTLTVKNFFLIPSLNLPSFCSKPLLLVLSQQALLNIPPRALLGDGVAVGTAGAAGSLEGRAAWFLNRILKTLGCSQAGSMLSSTREGCCSS